MFSRFFKKLYVGTKNWFNNYLATIPTKNKVWIGIFLSVITIGASLFFGDAIIFTVAMIAYLPPAIATYVICVAQEKKTLPGYIAVWLLYSQLVFAVSSYLMGEKNEMIDGAVVVAMILFGVIFLFSHFKKADEFVEKMGEGAEKFAEKVLTTEDSSQGAENESRSSVDADATAG